mgnify:CR=1 FL=1
MNVSPLVNVYVNNILMGTYDLMNNFNQFNYLLVNIGGFNRIKIFCK